MKSHFLTTISFLAGLVSTGMVAQAELPANFDAIEVRTGALYLQRADDPSGTLLVGPGATPLVSTDAVKPGEDTGWELQLFGHLNETTSLEFRYFHLDGFHYGNTFTNAGGIGFNDIFGSLGVFGEPATAMIDYTGELTNFEFNGRYRIHNRCELLCGVRHLQYHENLGGFFQAVNTPTNSLIANYETQNYMTGVQFGFDAIVFERGCFSIETQALTGIMNNKARSGIFLDGTGDLSDFNNNESFGQNNSVAFLNEFRIAGTYKFNCRASARAGYQFMALTNVATAANEVTDTNTAGLPLIQIPTHTTDTLIYHGLFAQLEFYLYE